MGILNVTPDSFFDGGRLNDQVSVRRCVESMLDSGVDYIDVGAESTRPGSMSVPAEEQIRRLRMVLDIVSDYDCQVTVDTHSVEVARFCLGYHVVVGINDVSGGRTKGLLECVASSGRFVILMHSRLTPDVMQQEPHYDDVVLEVQLELSQSVEKALSFGFALDKIWIDPGVGFAKTTSHSLSLLRCLDVFKQTGFPLLIGVSRKSFIGEYLNCSVEDRLAPSLSCVLSAYEKGVDVVRVHDFVETKLCLDMWSLLKGDLNE